MADGHLNKCKECTKKDVANRRALKMANDPDWVEKEMERCRVKARKEFPSRLYDPEARRIVNARYRENNQHKNHARSQLNLAVKSGKVVKLPCSVCGNVKSQAHHEDYSKPLDVIWLCYKHHGERHVQIGKEQRAAKRSS